MKNLYTLFFIVLPGMLICQTEPFGGGSADGFGMETSGVLLPLNSNSELYGGGNGDGFGMISSGALPPLEDQSFLYGGGLSDGFGMFGISNVYLLPVELLRFQAFPKEKNVLLEWATASEYHNDFFEIERSANLQSANSIGIVNGAGTTHLPQQYSFWDDNPLFGKSYYRLKQVDFDGSFEYSDWVNVLFGDLATFECKLYPNPVKKILQIEVWNLKEPLKQIAIFDEQGKLIQKNHILQSSSSWEGAFNCDVLADGNYFLVLMTAWERKILQFVKI